MATSQHTEYLGLEPENKFEGTPENVMQVNSLALSHVIRQNNLQEEGI